jgi:hypothetical protein
MPGLRPLVLLMLVGSLAPVQGEMWTNQAGRVIEARLEACQGDWVTLVRTNGAVLKLPLSALRPADQRRARLQKAQSIAPAFVLAAYKDAHAVLDRFERLPADQQTAASRAAANQMACSVFDARLKARAAELTDKAVLDEVKNLRALLTKPPQ